LPIVALCLYVCPFLRPLWWYPAPLAVAYSLWYTLRRPGPQQDNPYRKYCGAMGPIDRCADQFVAWLGRIKYFTSPFILAEDPGSYRITGKEIRELVDGNDPVLQPGDILLRGYDGYVDGIMIGILGGGEGLGKYFSHAALYVGALNYGQDKDIIARRLKTEDGCCYWENASATDIDKIRTNPQYYEQGPQRVIHSMGKGVFTEDILTFLRCDYLAVVRLPERIALSPEDLKKDKSLIRELPADADAIRSKLMRGESVTREDVFKVAKLSALGKIGSCYDFQFNELKESHAFSCSEFVYYCYKSIHCYLGLELKIKSIGKVLLRKKTISPSDIYDAAAPYGTVDSTKKLQVVWMNEALTKKQKAE
jgi:hypothetical protein